jgi:hypothetical protein
MVRLVCHGGPLDAGRTVGVNTVADSMRRQGLQWRKPKHSKGFTGQDIRHSSTVVMAPADYEHDAAQPADGKEAP